ncbi:DUF805 domain-containing protein [Herbiconiux sp. A18JL235]|uniref:DUF805 domain-containing protein n=1 Tax=Herbiconiux sp. A18JL235 TaxID=3152363 RepID=A0AB39BCA8_9MICO
MSEQQTRTVSMSFGEAIANGFRNYAQFEGRARLAEFWWFFLFVTLVGVGLGSLDSIAPSFLTIGSGLAGLWSLGTLLPTLGLAVRRLRDGGNSWYQLFWLLVPIAGVIVVVLRLCDPSRSASRAPDAPRI